MAAKQHNDQRLSHEKYHDFHNLKDCRIQLCVVLMSVCVCVCVCVLNIYKSFERVQSDFTVYSCFITMHLIRSSDVNEKKNRTPKCEP